MEISPNYDEETLKSCNGIQTIPTHAYYREGSILYLIGSTVLCKYDISDPHEPKLLAMRDIASEAIADPASNYIRKKAAHATAMVDIGRHLVISLRGGGGGVTNMDDGVIVGSLRVVDKQTLEPVKALDFENRVTYIIRFGYQQPQPQPLLPR